MIKSIQIICIVVWVTLTGCQNSKEKMLSIYYASEEHTFSVLIIAENEDFIAETPF